MGLSEILCMIIVVLLIAILILQLTGRRKSDIDTIKAILKRTAEEQREGVQKQIAGGATEQFARFDVIQKSIQDTLSANREEVNRQLAEFQRQMEARLTSVQKAGIESNERIGTTVTNALQMINTTLENKMKALQESNEKRLEQIQGVVDEKLQKTLETRLAQSFELVSKQLESVGQGLGEMKALAADTKSLKDALTNVKERGTYGEIRLEKLLSDILAPNQYETNVEIANGKRVEFAIKLPGSGDVPLLLPIDSKFPIEDYNRLLDAQDKQAIDEARRSLTAKIRAFAKEIHDKYIVPPKTADFALMFLPTEGLYAEVVQNAALFEELRDKYSITAVGATTLSAFLASLQMGFKTLAIEQRSQEVWDTLRAVKSEFIKFGDLLDKAHRQIQTADNTLAEIVGRRTRAINRTLRGVEELTEADTAPLMTLEDMADE